jgi:hypothetical protein
MTLDDLKRLFTRQTLFRLDSVLAPKLASILYALGLAGILLWAVRHLFASFATGFGNGLWGLLEIAVFGLLMLVALRVGCEALLVYFKAHETEGETVNRSRYSASLLDEVREAIRDLAKEDEEADFAEADEYITPATEPAPRAADPTPPRPPEPPVTMPPDLGTVETPGEPVTPPTPKHTVRRTAKRTPPAPK